MDSGRGTRASTLGADTICWVTKGSPKTQIPKLHAVGPGVQKSLTDPNVEPTGNLFPRCWPAQACPKQVRERPGLARTGQGKGLQPTGRKSSLGIRREAGTCSCFLARL